MAKNELVSLALIYNKPRHAYALGSIIKDMGLEHWAHISSASIYNTLNRLHTRGLVAVTTQKVGNMPSRKVYSITPAGRERLAKELRSAFRSCTLGDNPFQLAVNFSFALSDTEAIEALQKRIELLQQMLAHVRTELLYFTRLEVETAVITVEAGIAHLEIELGASQRMLTLLSTNPQRCREQAQRFLEGDHAQQLQQFLQQNNTSSPSTGSSIP
jgi:DNA-binding PadR family transcriptional regulator